MSIGIIGAGEGRIRRQPPAGSGRSQGDGSSDVRGAGVDSGSVDEDGENRLKDLILLI